MVRLVKAEKMVLSGQDDFDSEYIVLDGSPDDNMAFMPLYM